MFQDSADLAPVLVLERALACSSATEPSPGLLPVTLALGQLLSDTEQYIFCISLTQVSTSSQ